MSAKTLTAIFTAVFAAIIVASIAMIIYDRAFREKTEMTAVYQGYAIEDGQTYPIIIIDDEEVISDISQKIRDPSFKGSEIRISAAADDIRHFRIIWD